LRNQVQALEFVDAHGEAVLQLPELIHLSLPVMELIIGRQVSQTSRGNSNSNQTLQAEALCKWRAAERWSHFVNQQLLDRGHPDAVPQLLSHFVPYRSDWGLERVEQLKRIF